MSLRLVCLWCLVTLALSSVSRWQLRADAPRRCALDGALISGAARVDLLEDAGQAHSFCSIECALAWPRSPTHGPPRRFVVHEEENGLPLDPRAATFVRSNLRAAGARGCLRAFKDPLTAAQHVQSFGGVLVPNPFPQDD
jgi:hypothetical protein